MTPKFQSTKVYDGFSTCFRQWRAGGTHCKFLHGYGTSVKVVWSGDLDERNWVIDFGVAKRSTILIDGKTVKDWFNWLLDHTVIVAEDDPFLGHFQELDLIGAIQLRTIPHVGAERFAEYIYHKLSTWVGEATEGRCKVDSVEFMEHSKNSAIYSYV